MGISFNNSVFNGKMRFPYSAGKLGICKVRKQIVQITIVWYTIL